MRKALLGLGVLLAALLFPATSAAQVPTCNAASISATWVDNHNRLSTSVGSVANATSVWIAIWSTANGQDDLIWQAAGNIGGGTWISDFWPLTYEAGQYNVSVYMWNANYSASAIGCGSITTSRTLPPTPPPTCTGVSAIVTDWYWGNLLRVDVGGVSGAAAVGIATWSDSGGQDDLVWTSGVDIDNAQWLAWIPPTLSTMGVYSVNVYMSNSTGYPNPYNTSVPCGGVSTATRPTIQTNPDSCP
jgi:hypothetical protein